VLLSARDRSVQEGASDAIIELREGASERLGDAECLGDDATQFIEG
jgi:hypothetical protein